MSGNTSRYSMRTVVQQQELVAAKVRKPALHNLGHSIFKHTHTQGNMQKISIMQSTPTKKRFIGMFCTGINQLLIIENFFLTL